MGHRRELLGSQAASLDNSSLGKSSGAGPAFSPALRKGTIMGRPKLHKECHTWGDRRVETRTYPWLAHLQKI